jgi:tRNA threonylcarbamoyladenosine biosynthesis protein TsaB
MFILAIDTATEACSAAVLTDTGVIDRFELAPRRHAELILPMVEDVLAQGEIALSRLDAIAFGRGPGSFTGVRLAASIAQGIAFAADVPVVPVSTLAAMAAKVHHEQQTDYAAIAIDARMGEIYWGLYQADAVRCIRAVTDECVCEPERIPSHTVGCRSNVYGAGSGWQKYAGILSARIPVSAYQTAFYPDAAYIARLAAIALEQGEEVPAEQALPVYLRDKVTT